jgi:hypothetical protein
MGQKLLLALDSSLPQICERRARANRPEQRIFVHGWVRAIAPVNCLLQLAKRRIGLLTETQDFCVAV